MKQKIYRRVFGKSVIAGTATLSFSQPLLAQTIIEDERVAVQAMTDLVNTLLKIFCVM